MIQNLALLFVELITLGGLALALHAKRKTWGLAPVLFYLAGLVSILNASAPIAIFLDAGPLRFEVSNTTMVPVVLMTLLVLYIAEGTAVARLTILGIVGLSTLVVAIQWSRHAHLALPGAYDVPSVGADHAIFTRSWPFTLASITAFTASMATISVVFQTLANRTRSAPTWLLVGIAFLGAVAVDDLVFRLAAFGLEGLTARVSSGLPAKAVSALVLWPLAAIYLARVAPQARSYVGTENRRALDLLFGTYQQRDLAVKEIELQRSMSEERLKAVVSQAPIVLYSIDTEGIFQVSEGAGLVGLGLEPGEVVGRSAFELFPSEEADLRAVLDGRTFTSNTTLGDTSYDISYAPILEKGEVVGGMGIATDITQRVSAERALSESEVRFRSTFEQAAIGLLHATADGHVLLANQTVHEMLGLGQGKLAGVDVREMIHESDLPMALAGIRELLDGAREQFSGDIRLVRPGGGFVWTSTTTSLVRDAAGEPSYFIIVIEDQTERRVTEEKLRQAQKMEAVGQLTGGVAHDFNNLLTVVMGSLEITLEEGGPVDSHREALHQAVMAAQRGASLTERLLSFSRRQTLAPENVDVGELLEGMRDLLVRTLGDPVAVHFDVAPDVGLCRADQAQIESAVLNLSLNARDAMPEGGTLTLEARRVVTTPPDDVSGPEPYVRITVRDQGVGIPPATRDRVFEPFFTTKAIGKGSGLGLSMVYGFAQQSGGFVAIESEVGEGTAVHVYLPIASDDA